MSDVAKRRMSATEFFAWAPAQPGRHELVAGEAVAMAPERAAHARIEATTWLALRKAIQRAGSTREAATERMAVSAVSAVSAVLAVLAVLADLAVLAVMAALTALTALVEGKDRRPRV